VCRYIERRAMHKLKQPHHVALILPYLSSEAVEMLKTMAKSGAPILRGRGRPKKTVKTENDDDAEEEEDAAEHFAKALAAAIKAVDERAGGGRVLGGRLLRAAGEGAGAGAGVGVVGRRGKARQRRTQQQRNGGGGGGGEGAGAGAGGASLQGGGGATGTETLANSTPTKQSAEKIEFS
jgi:hypothetical protein